MKIIENMVQGSAEWLAIRAKRFTASEAAAACGAHKYMSRNDLLKQKSTGITPEVDAHQQRIFDKGHEYEAAARPIAEGIIGEELFPCTCEDDTETYLASMDGLNMLGTMGWEHKSLNDKLRQATAETLEDHYKWQMDHQMMVSGAEKVLFMASDGTKENCVWFWYERDEARIEKLKAHWDQFAKDLAEYKPEAVVESKSKGKAPDALPALSVQVTGMVTASNLKEFEETARATLASINTDLQTDQDFADAEKAVKFCKDVEKRLAGAKENVLGQMQTVDEVVKTIDRISEETRQLRLSLSKAVKEQKEARKLEILNNYTGLWNKHLGDLEKSLEAEAGGITVTLNDTKADFASAMKGKKTITSLQSACDDELARAKIAASEVADIVRVNIRQLNEHAADYKFLFNDFGIICQKPADDVAAVVKMRVSDYAAEQEAKAKREAELAASREAAAKAMAEAKQNISTAGNGLENQKPAEVPRNTQELPSDHTPSADELIAVICQHYGVDNRTAWGWVSRSFGIEAA